MWTTKTTVLSCLIDLGEDILLHVDYVKYRRVKNDFGEDVVVHVRYGEHRLVTIDLEDDVIDHADYPDHRLVTTDFGEDVDYVKYSVLSRMTLERMS